MATVTDFSQDREFKAHIYQHLLELQAYLTEDAQVEVVVTPQAKKRKKEPICLKLVTTLDDYQLECDGQDANVYTAFTIAKEKMLCILREIYAETGSNRDRDAQIDAVIEGRATLH